MAVFSAVSHNLQVHARRRSLRQDFHAGRNFIATCGLDHCVKIWRVPQLSTPDPDDMVYHRDQLPVFSSSAIHDSKVVSIRWYVPRLIADCDRAN